jgi:hypothetical protein
VSKPKSRQEENNPDPVFPKSTTPVETIIATPHKKEPKPKVSVPPSAPKKSPPLRPTRTTTRSTTTKPIPKGDEALVQEDRTGVVFKLPAIPRNRRTTAIGSSPKKYSSTHEDEFELVTDQSLVSKQKMNRLLSPIEAPKEVYPIEPSTKRDSTAKPEADPVVHLGRYAGPDNEETPNGFFEPDGIISHIYVQGSE